ncbi:hypothetical protein [Schumannella luteola]
MFGIGGKKTWEPAEATIVLVNIIKVSSDGLTPTREWAADVRRADGSVVRARIGEPRWVTDFWPPDAGAVVEVEVEATSGEVRFDVRNDPQLTMKGQDRLRAEAFQRAIDGQ